ncbi:MFS transporter [Nonomuraea sp. B10E15]|uniref:MFS transporter n=1 Tax=Nonomuraea sp. B10E15 TaxID=3153560 RepID=UPI00325CB727
MVSYRSLFAIREFRYLYAGLSLSYIGDKFASLAVAVLVFDRTGSGLLTGVAQASAFLPALVAGPLFGALADRLPRRRVLIVCDMARAFLVMALLVPGAPMWLLIVLLYTGSLFTPPFVAARAALIPEILDGAASIAGNGLNRITYQLCQVAAYGAGGMLVAATGHERALVINAATFAISAALTAIGVRSRPRALPRDSARSVLGDAREGMRYVFADPWLRACLLLVWSVSMFAHAPEAIAHPYATHLGAEAPAAGLLLSATALGFALGTAFLTRLVPSLVLDRLIVPFAVLAGGAMVPLILSPPLLVVLVSLFVSGVGCSFSAPLLAMFARRVDLEYRGRAVGVAIAGLTGGQGIGFLLAGALFALDVDPARTSAVCGAAALVAAITAGFAVSRASRCVAPGSRPVGSSRSRPDRRRRGAHRR